MRTGTSGLRCRRGPSSTRAVRSTPTSRRRSSCADDRVVGLAIICTVQTVPGRVERAGGVERQGSMRLGPVLSFNLRQMIQIGIYPSRSAAELAQGALAAAGIESVIESDDAGGAYPFGLTGGARLLVDEADAEARRSRAGGLPLLGRRGAVTAPVSRPRFPLASGVKLGTYSWLIRGLESTKSAVARLQAIAMLCTTATRRSALTSTSWGWGSSGSQKKMTASIRPSAIAAPTC